MTSAARVVTNMWTIMSEVQPKEIIWDNHCCSGMYVRRKQLDINRVVLLRSTDNKMELLEAHVDTKIPH